MQRGMWFADCRTTPIKIEQIYFFHRPDLARALSAQYPVSRYSTKKNRA